MTFIKFLDQIGAPTERFLKKAHLPVCGLDNPENLLPLNQCFAFAELAAHSEGIENLGAIVGYKTQLSQLGAFGALVSQSLTLYELFGKLIQLHKTLVTGEQIWFTEDGNCLWLHHQFTVPDHIQTYQAQYFSNLVYLNIIRLGAEYDWQPDQFHLKIGRNKVFLSLDCLSNTPIHFHQSSNAICFSKDLLSKPLNYATKLSLTGNAEETLKLTSPSDNFTDSLRQLILLLLPEGYPSLTIAAQAAGLTIRTFQRRLENNNLNYSQLVEQVRFEQAIHLLQDRTNQLIDIAFDLGYTDAANFSRAFKRWTGVSPRKFRDLHFQG
ncbi:MAG: helix-turn-helix domain-containing protein [Phormidium sp.]